MTILSRAKQFTQRRPAALTLIRQRDFRNFWIGNASADLAFDMRIVVMGWLVLELTNSQFWVGLIAGLAGVPILILSLVAGAVTDRSDKKRLLIVTRIIPSAVTFLLAYLVTSELIEPWHLVLFALAGGSTMAFAAPAKRAFVADIVERRHLFAANSLSATASNAGEIFGSAIAGYLIATRGVDAGFYVVGGLYLIGVIFIARVRRRPQTRTVNETSIREDIVAGLKYTRQTQPILGILLITAVAVFATAIFPLMPVYARDVLNVGASGFGIMSAALGAGFLVGSFLTVFAGNIPRKGLLLVATGAVWDVSMALFGFSRIFPVSVALIFIQGVGGAFFFTVSITMLQSYSSDEMRGRVMSLHGLANSTVPLGMIVGGAVAETISNEFALSLGILIATPVGIVIYLTSPAFRRA